MASEVQKNLKWDLARRKSVSLGWGVGKGGDDKVITTLFSSFIFFQKCVGKRCRLPRLPCLP